MCLSFFFGNFFVLLLCDAVLVFHCLGLYDCNSMTAYLQFYGLHTFKRLFEDFLLQSTVSKLAHNERQALLLTKFICHALTKTFMHVDLLMKNAFQASRTYNRSQTVVFWPNAPDFDYEFHEVYCLDLFETNLSNIVICAPTVKEALCVQKCFVEKMKEILDFLQVNNATRRQIYNLVDKAWYDLKPIIASWNTLTQVLEQNMDNLNWKEKEVLKEFCTQFYLEFKTQEQLLEE